jgi:hypothetical protein
MTATTILEVFEPPDGKFGHSAVLVAMTGAEDFLEAALVNFTGLKARQRAELGITLAYLVLDPHGTPSRTGVIPPNALPGLHELQPRSVDAASWLHAKLVLLAFAQTRTGEPTDLRLAILTANFTYTCARHLLELAWVVDVPLDGSALAIDRADIAAAASFVNQLIERRYYLDERHLPPKQRSLTRRLGILLDACADNAPQKILPGFIHSLEEPLYPQIRSQMPRLLTRGRRNLLLCGSGFYETPTACAGKPTVLEKLEELGVFTDNVRRIAIAEPKMAGAIAPWIRGNAVEGWEVVAAHDPRGAGRTLHAKFIYAGYWRGDAASNGCLYLGSGNLSRRGLFTSGAQTTDRRLSPSGHDGVNIECGVVFSVPERMTSDDLANRLFWRDKQDELDVEAWEPGTSPEPDDLTLIVASPILSAELGGNRELRFRWRADVPADGRFSVRVGTVDWLGVTSQQVSITLAEHEQATALHVRDDQTDQEWSVPIVDPTGRVCWSPPTFSTYDEALAALLDFPIRSAEASGDDEDGDGEDNGDDTGPANAAPKEDHVKSYALHAAAKLIEETAALQRSLPREKLDDWFDHIERFFHASFPAELIATWKEHRIDVFAHLAKPKLRPPKMSAKQRGRYDAILASVASTWGLR